VNILLITDRLNLFLYESSINLHVKFLLLRPKPKLTLGTCPAAAAPGTPRLPSKKTRRKSGDAIGSLTLSLPAPASPPPFPPRFHSARGPPLPAAAPSLLPFQPARPSSGVRRDPLGSGLVPSSSGERFLPELLPSSPAAREIDVNSRNGASGSPIRSSSPKNFPGLAFRELNFRGFIVGMRLVVAFRGRGGILLEFCRPCVGVWRTRRR
jgi:hypothetical protein